jgi:hypothetical protein|tara:strand:+ start:92 stop:520 length:429 start_codon:yes stop_codon:yes gene_type:complete
MAFKMKAGKEGPMKKNFPSVFKKDLPEITIESYDEDYSEPFVREFPHAPVIQAGKIGKDQFHIVRGDDPTTVGEVKGELGFRNPKRKGRILKGAMGPTRVTRQKSYYMKDGKKTSLDDEKYGDQGRIVSTKKIKQKRETKGK